MLGAGAAIYVLAGGVLFWGSRGMQAIDPAIEPGANRRTLQRDLKAMVEKGLLVERGAGPTDPTRHYRLEEAVLGPGREL